MPSSRRRPVLRNAIGLLVGLLLAELLSRLILSFPSVTRQLQGLGRGGQYLDTMARYADLRARNPSDWNYSRPNDVDPNVGWTNRPGTFSIDDQQVTINSEGLRSPRNYALQKPSGVLRIEIFGDSYIFGSQLGVPNEKVAAVRVEAGLPGSEVLNFGVPGYGLDQMLLRFEGDGARYHPDVVVIAVMSVVLTRCNERLGTWFKPYFTLAGDGLELHGVPVPSLEQAYHRYLMRPRLLDVLSLAVPRATTRLNDRLLAHIFARFIRSVRAAGARPLLVLAPNFNEYDGRTAPYDVFHAACRSEGAECVDMMPAFERANSEGLLRSELYHWNIAGNQVFADQIVEYLKAHPNASR